MLSPRDLRKEAVTPKSWYVLDIAIKILVHKFGEPRLNGFLRICLQEQISKAMTPAVLENEVASPKS